MNILKIKFFGQASFMPAPEIGIKSSTKTLLDWGINGNGRHYVSLRDKEGNSLMYSVYDKTTTFAIGQNNIMHMKKDGRVSIGDEVNLGKLMRINGGAVDISPDKYRLFVEKGILTEKVKVAVSSNTDWADYVFEEGYEMLPINELEGYVSENKHLPNVPSAEEMVENGLDIAKMDAKLLEKIEEAYLRKFKGFFTKLEYHKQVTTFFKRN